MLKIIPLICSLIISSSLVASVPTLWLMENVTVKAHSLQSYEENVEDLVQQIDHKRTSVPAPRWSAYVDTDNGTYTYLSPVDGFAGIEKQLEYWHEVMRGEGALQQKISEQIQSWDFGLLALNEDLSYIPPQSDEKEEEYCVVQVINVAPSKIAEYEHVLASWKQAFEKSKKSYGWFTYAVVMGSDLPQYLIVLEGSSLSDFKQKYMSGLEVAEENELFNSTEFGVISNSTWFSCEYVPELSHPRSTMAAPEHNQEPTVIQKDPPKSSSTRQLQR